MRCILTTQGAGFMHLRYQEILSLTGTRGALRKIYQRFACGEWHSRCFVK